MNTTQMLEKLVGLPTVSRDSNLALIEFVENWLDDHGVQATRISNDEGNKANLLATIGPQRAGGVVLSGHTDVVPVDGQPWSSDPFDLTLRDGRLFGRGSSDMKGFIAAALAALPRMKKLQRPIHLAFSYDEEVGCQGAPRMIGRMPELIEQPLGVIVGEPTLMRSVTGHKGIAVLRTRVTGYERHSSQTDRGVSAVMTAARLVEYLNQMAESLAANADPGNQFSPPYTSIHVGVIHGGTAVNIVSRECVFEWDIRPLPGEDPQILIDQFQRWCRDEVLPEMKKRWARSDIEHEIISRVPALPEVADNPALGLVSALTGNSDTAKVAYTAEAGQFWEAGYPTVICGPGSIDQAHQPDEFIDPAQLDAMDGVMDRLINQLEG